MNEFDHGADHAVQSGAGWRTRTKIYLTLFSGWNFWGMLLFGFVQQIIVASSVIFLTNAASLLSAGSTEKAIHSFFLFLATMVLPYIPGVLSQYCWQVWKATMVRDFNNFAIVNIRARPSSYGNQQASELMTSVFSNSVPAALTQVADFAYDFSQCVFNSVLGSLVIAVVVDPRLGLAYLITVIVCGVYIRHYYSTSAAASEAAEKERLDLSSITRRLWPNIMLRNSLALNTWADRLGLQHTRVVGAVQKEARIRNGSSLILSLASVVPVVIICGLLIHAHIDDQAYLASLFVTMPRMFSILALVSMLLFMIFDFSSVYGQLRVVEQLFDDAPSVGSIDFRRITILADGEAVSVDSLDAFIAVCLRSSRVILHGENGAGKTSLLLSTKESLGDQAFYLPAASALDLPSKQSSGSTGQIKRNEIEAVLRDLAPCLLLLDEWDANLDSDSRAQIASSLSEAVIRGYKLVEISHR